MSIEFAADAPDAATRDVLTAQLGAEDGPAWALVDAALIDASRFFSHVRARKWPVHPAYEGSALAAYGQQGVWLIPLPNESASRVPRIRELLHLTGPATATSWLYTRASLPALQALAAYLGVAHVEAREAPIHCRFADTRTLPDLLGQLNPAQCARVHAVIDDWAWLDRRARLQRWRPAGAAQPADEARTLHLTIEQFRVLRDGGEADGIFDGLLAYAPSSIPARGRGECYERLVRSLAAADEYGVCDGESRLQFALLSLTAGEDFHRLPALKDTWASVRAGRRLIDCMQEWDDAVWGAVERNGDATKAGEP